MIQALQLGLIAGALLGGLAIVLRSRSHKLNRRRARERNIVYRNLAQRQGLTHLEEKTPDHLTDRAETFRGTRPGKLTNVLLGKDTDGTYYVARREGRQVEEQMLLFEAGRAARLEGFHVESNRRRPQDTTTWQDRLRGKVVTEEEAASDLRMRWDVRKPSDLDDSLLAVAGRLVRHCSEESAPDAGLMLGLSVRDRQILVHSNGHLQLSMVGEFIERARRLRELVMDALNDQGTTRWSNNPTAQSVDQDAIERIMQQLSPSKQVAPVPQSPAASAPLLEIPDPEQDAVIAGRGIHDR